MNSMATNVLTPFLSRMDQFILFLREGLNNDEQSEKKEVKRSESNDENLKPDLRQGEDNASPLSGSEADEDLRAGTDDDDDEDIEGTIFRHRLDTSFPLSGGETDDDLDKALD